MKATALVFAGVVALMTTVAVAPAVVADGRGALPTRAGLFVANQDGRPPAVLPVDSPPVESPAAGKKLSNVPAWTWCYGCANTGAAMIMGYYDRRGYPNMYAGNAGETTAALASDVPAGAAKLCPLNNETAWPDKLSGVDAVNYGESPLAACHLGIDGRAERGYVDECWIGLNNGSPDPWMVHGWTLHEPCSLADTMWTSRSDKYNFDGGTQFVLASLGDPVRDFDDWEPDLRDGSHGMRLYAQSRGYSVDDNYNQLILPTPQGHHNIWGFTFDNYVDEIDAGRPVILMAGPHAFVGFGYGANETVYIRTTWDNGEHSMRWGGRYGGYEHWAVSVFDLAAPPPDTYPDLLVRAPGDAGFLGNGLYDDLGHQSLKRPVRPATSITYEFALQNDAAIADTVTVKGTGGDGASGTPVWTVKYLKNLTGATDITAQVTSGAGWAVALDAGKGCNFRAVVTPNGAVQEGASYPINVTARSGKNTRRRDGWLLTSVRRKAGTEPSIVPSPVSDLKATRATGATKAVITFKRACEDNYACTKYDIYRKCLDPKGPLTLIKSITASGQDSYTYNDTAAGATKPYDYSVRSVNGTRQSALCTAPLLNPALTPSPPTQLSARRVNGDATRAAFTWTRSTADPNAVSHYLVSRRCTTDSGPWEDVGTVPRSGTATKYTFSDSGLQEYKAYQYGVRAVNGAKQSTRPVCALQNAQYDPNVTPRAPTDLIASRNNTIGMTKAEITLHKSPDDKSGCTQYKLYRRTIPPPYGAWEEIGVIPATGSAQYAYTDTGLASSKDYQYGAVAFNGSTKQSGTALTTLTNPTVTPAPPADLVLEDYGTSGTRVEVTIVASPNDPRGVTDYGLFRRMINPDTGWEQIAQGNSDGSASYGYIDNGLATGQEYAYAVIAVNSEKESDLVERRITPAAGAAAVVAQATAMQTPVGAQINLRLTAAAQVSVEVMNVAGRPIRRVCADRTCEAGPVLILWDARSEAGTPVPAGRYLVRIT
ncbi:MAG: hypothetical protein FJX74_14270, partial [Armatimonadetes bacterium]|nr:hypothetical protein [Armatimonadota bacterium]